MKATVALERFQKCTIAPELEPIEETVGSGDGLNVALRRVRVEVVNPPTDSQRGGVDP